MLPGNPNELDPQFHFPQNVMRLIGHRFGMEDSYLDVLYRPVRTTDRDFTVCIIPGEWAPQQGSLELGRKNTESTLNRYMITVQCLVTDMEEERGIERASALSDAVRTLLYRDTSLALGFQSLKVSLATRVESAMKMGITRQEFLNNTAQGMFIYLSTLDLWVETETR